MQKTAQFSTFTKISTKTEQVKILVIEDDNETADYLVNGLRERGHVADRASEGHQGLVLGCDKSYDVIVLDRMLPNLDGISVLKALRAAGVKTPVLFLTAMGSIEDRVGGLEAGGDDYLVKPFAFSELYARLNSLLRRPPLAEEVTKYKVGELELNLLDRTAKRAGQTLDLHPTEFRLLEYLMKNAGKIVTRTMLLESVWEFHFDPKTNIVETHVSRLRSKIDREFAHEMLKTVRGAGYKLDA
ncbi:MAG: response regulator transcription factor [Proteobacteria bacterium]|nr:MAG: response regulator transcription factor [Pseudomonadota bacterium]